MRRTITVHRASPVADQVIPEVTVIVATDVPELPPMSSGQTVQESLATLATLYQQDAIAIARALRDSLPGGTFDRLVCELLTMKASHFRVPWGGR
jgi:hypothetical protein